MKAKHYSRKTVPAQGRKLYTQDQYRKQYKWASNLKKKNFRAGGRVGDMSRNPAGFKSTLFHLVLSFLSSVGLFTNLMAFKWLIFFALRTLNVELMTPTEIAL